MQPHLSVTCKLPIRLRSCSLYILGSFQLRSYVLLLRMDILRLPRSVFQECLSRTYWSANAGTLRFTRYNVHALTCRAIVHHKKQRKWGEWRHGRTRMGRDAGFVEQGNPVRNGNFGSYSGVSYVSAGRTRVFDRQKNSCQPDRLVRFGSQEGRIICSSNSQKRS
jgi:hypothetical protein